jgi:hypothetical protein
VYWVAIGVPKETEGRFIFLAVVCGENESVTFSRSCAAAWTPSEAVPPGIYEISTETLILRHQLLNGYKLAAGNRHGDAIYYPLVCDGSNGTTGTAQLHADADRVKGVLQIKMGGKNMTFSQRIEAKRQGDCDSLP